MLIIRGLVDFSVSGFLEHEWHEGFLNTNITNGTNVFWTRFIHEHECPECPECFFGYVLFLNTNETNGI